MSKENVARFIDALAKQQGLNRTVAAAEQTTAGWTDAANAAGFEFAKEELHVMLQALTGEQVEEDRIIASFTSAQAALDDAQLDQVVGGRGVAAPSVLISPKTTQRLAAMGVSTADNVAIVHHTNGTGSPGGGSSF